VDVKRSSAGGAFIGRSVRDYLVSHREIAQLWSRSELEFCRMTEPTISPELVQKHNLTREEYQKILAILGREPNYTELGVFSVM